MTTCCLLSSSYLPEITATSLSPTSLHQSKQEAAGLGCDVVRVEVDESLTKEQLLEMFMACGRDTHTDIDVQMTHTQT